MFYFLFLFASKRFYIFWKVYALKIKLNAKNKLYETSHLIINKLYLMIQIKSQSITTEAESLHSLIFGLSLKHFAAQKSKDVTQNPAVDKKPAISWANFE